MKSVKRPSQRAIKPGSWKLIVFYLFVLVAILIMMWKMPAIVSLF